MALTNAEHQAATRERRKRLIEGLLAENARLRAGKTHAACDARIAKLEAEIAEARAAVARLTAF